MKIAKQIIVNVLIAFIVVTCIVFFVKFTPWLNHYKQNRNGLNDYLKYIIENPNLATDSIESIEKQISICQQRISEYATYISLAAIAIAACAFLFVYCNPRLFRLSTWTNLSEEWGKNKEERVARKQANKQKKIAELQAKIEDLQKDNINSNQ